MARKATGSVRVRSLVGGESAYYARFTSQDGKRQELPLGTSPEWSRSRAEHEVKRIIEQVRLGVWVDPREQARVEAAKAAAVEDPTFHVAASEWWAKKSRGVGESTEKDYLEWRLKKHLIPYFSFYADGRPRPLSSITVRTVDDFRAACHEARLGAVSINKLVSTLESVLDLAADYNYGGLTRATNPARGEDRREKVPEEAESGGDIRHLEYDQLQVLLEAADVLEREARPAYRHFGRREMMMVLFVAGLRVSELCQLRWRWVDLDRGLLHVHKSKTKAGVRDVPLPTALIDALADWKARSPHSRQRDLVFPTATGGARDKDNVNKRIMRPIVKKAALMLDQRDQAQLPGVEIDGEGAVTIHPRRGPTPHMGRRTAITYLIEAGHDVGYTQDIVGHKDPRLTLIVYRQRRYRPVDPRIVALMHGPEREAARGRAV